MISGNSLVLGQFIPGDSLLHRLDPRTKLLGSSILTVGIFLADAYSSLVPLAIFAALICGLSRLELRNVARSVRPILITVFAASFLHLFASPGPYLVELGPIKLSQPGLAEAGRMDLRLASVMIISSLVSWTTSPMALTEGIERLLAPLGRFGLPVHQFAMTVGIALRFIPTCASELERLMKAQTARGVDFAKGSLYRRARDLAPLVIPLIVATLERSEELALAMESRCYCGRGRSSFRHLQVTSLDVAALVCCAGLAAASLLLL